MFARCLHQCVNGWGRRCAACRWCPASVAVLCLGGRCAGVADALITDTGVRHLRP